MNRKYVNKKKSCVNYIYPGRCLVEMIFIVVVVVLPVAVVGVGAIFLIKKS